MASPNETSPLLTKSVKTSVDSDSISTCDPDLRNNDNALPNGLSRRRLDEESQEEDATRQAQYEGLPEVKKRLKFILPALSIGVCQWSTPFILHAS